MAKRVVNNFTDEWFESRGYIKTDNGGWSPPPIKSSYIKSLTRYEIPSGTTHCDTKDILIAKVKVNETPDFTIKPVTEWFIRGYSVPSKKNSRQNFVKNGVMRSIPSEKHAEYVKLTAIQYDVFGKEFRRTVEILGLTYPLRVEFHFIRGGKHSFDYANALQTCEDIMKDQYKKVPTILNGKKVNKMVLVKKGWFTDDSADYLIPSFKPYTIDKEMPGVIIKLLTNK